MAEQCRDAVYGDSVKRFRDSQAHKLSPTAVTVSPSGAFAYTASIDGNMVKWRLLDDGAQRVKRVLAAGGHGDKQEQPKKKKANKKKHAARINALAISSDGKFLVRNAVPSGLLVHRYNLDLCLFQASGDDSNLVNIWNADTMDHIRTFRGHRDAVSGLAFRRKTHTLYSCSFDRSVKIWNLDEMAYVETLFGHQDRITGIDAGVRERAVTSGGRDGSVRVWKIVEESQLVFNGPANSTDSVKLINEEHFATCGEDGHISLWGNMKKKPLFTLQSAHGNDPVNGEPNWVSALATLPMSDLIASGMLRSLLGAARLFFFLRPTAKLSAEGLESIFCPHPTHPTLIENASYHI
jgi:ribosomal RNA-processing protein 9